MLEFKTIQFLNQNTENIESKLKRILEELTIFILSMANEIISCNSIKSNDIKEIDKLNKKKISLDSNNSSQEYTVELIKELYCLEENDNLIFTNIKNIGFTFLYDLLSRETKRDMIHRLISQI